MPQRVLAKLEEEGGFADEFVDAEEAAKLGLAVDHRLTRHRLQPKRARWSAPCSLSVGCLFVCRRQCWPPRSSSAQAMRRNGRGLSILGVELAKKPVGWTLAFTTGTLSGCALVRRV